MSTNNVDGQNSPSANSPAAIPENTATVERADAGHAREAVKALSDQISDLSKQVQDVTRLFESHLFGAASSSTSSRQAVHLSILELRRSLIEAIMVPGNSVELHHAVWAHFELFGRQIEAITAAAASRREWRLKHVQARLLECAGVLEKYSGRFELIARTAACARYRDRIEGGSMARGCWDR